MTRLPLQFTESDFQLAMRCMAAPEAFRLTGPEMRACQAVIEHFRDGRPLPDEDMAIATRLLQTVERTNRRRGDDGGETGGVATTVEKGQVNERQAEARQAKSLRSGRS